VLAPSEIKSVLGSEYALLPKNPSDYCLYQLMPPRAGSPAIVSIRLVTQGGRKLFEGIRVGVLGAQSVTGLDVEAEFVPPTTLLMLKGDVRLELMVPASVSDPKAVLVRLGRLAAPRM
jgi:hypothetical protein